MRPVIRGLRVGTVNGLITGLSSADWLLETALAPAVARRRWESGRCAVLMCGPRFDVVRLPAVAGIQAVRGLQTAGAYIGPIVHQAEDGEHRLDFLITPGTSVWNECRVGVVFGSGKQWLCPPPRTTELHPPQCPAAWFIPPGGGLTEPAALRATVTAPPPSAEPGLPG